MEIGLCTKEGRPAGRWSKWQPAQPRTNCVHRHLYGDDHFLSLFRSRNKQRSKKSKKNRYSSSSIYRILWKNKMMTEQGRKLPSYVRWMPNGYEIDKYNKTNIVTRILWQRQMKACFYSCKGWIWVILIIVIGTTNYCINFGSKIHAENDPNNYDTKNVNTTTNNNNS